MKHHPPRPTTQGPPPLPFDKRKRVTAEQGARKAWQSRKRMAAAKLPTRLRSIAHVLARFRAGRSGT